MSVINTIIDGVKYFTVGETAKIVGKSSQTIKRWELAGKIPTAKRLKSNGWRVFTEAQLNKIKAYAHSLEDPKE